VTAGGADGTLDEGGTDCSGAGDDGGADPLASGEAPAARDPPPDRPPQPATAIAAPSASTIASIAARR
jgi:hypothetical protein